MGSVAVGSPADHVHDAWFEAGNIHFDSTRESVSMLIRRTSVGRSQDTWLLLWVREALGCSIEEEADTGTYDLNTIDYDAEGQALVISSCFPFRVTVHVRGLHLVLDELSLA